MSQDDLNEEEDKKNHIKEKIKNNGGTINLLVSIATMLTSIIALFTLLEIKKQREAIYIPDVEISNIDLDYLYYGYDGEAECLNNFIGLFKNEESKDFTVNDAKEVVKDEKYISSTTLLNFELRNVGLGVAKKIKVKFRYDEKEMVKYLNGFYNRDSTKNIEITRKKGLYYLKIAGCEFETKISLSDDRDWSAYTEKEFLEPIHIQREKFTFEPDNSYFDFVLVCGVLDDIGFNNKLEIPPFEFILEYKDIADKLRTKQYTGVVSIGTGGGSCDHEGKYLCHFEGMGGVYFKRK